MTSAGRSDSPERLLGVARQVEQVADRPGEHDDHRDREADEEDVILTADQIHRDRPKL